MPFELLVPQQGRHYIERRVLVVREGYRVVVRISPDVAEYVGMRPGVRAELEIGTGEDVGLLRMCGRANAHVGYAIQKMGAGRQLGIKIRAQSLPVEITASAVEVPYSIQDNNAGPWLVIDLRSFPYRPGASHAEREGYRSATA